MSRKRYEQLEILQDPDRKPKRKRKLTPFYIPWRWVVGSLIVGAGLVIGTLGLLIGNRPISLPEQNKPILTTLPTLPPPIPTMTGQGEYLRDLFWSNGHVAAAGSASLRMYDDNFSPGTAQWMSSYGESVNRVFNKIALSPDGSQVAGIMTLMDSSGQSYSDVAVWDTTTKELLRAFKAHIGGNSSSLYRGDVKAIAYSPDSSRMITGAGDGQLVVWDADTGDQITTLETGGVGTWELGFQPNGHLAAFINYDQENNIVQIWDLDEQRKVSEIPFHHRSVYQIDFSPDAAYMAAKERAETDKWFISIWNLLSGEQIGTIPLAENEIMNEMTIDVNLLALAGYVGPDVDPASGTIVETHTAVRVWGWGVGEDRKFSYSVIGEKHDFLIQVEIRELHFTKDSSGIWLNYITNVAGTTLQRWNLTTNAVISLSFW